MSATLLALLHELDPSLRIAIFERLESLAQESSQAMNNAWTWHSWLCELNYTPQKEDGSIDVSKAIHIAESFALSKQFRAYLTKKQYFKKPQDFIHAIPHCSFVSWSDNVKYLKKRYAALKHNPIFKSMQYSEDPKVLQQWMPLIMKWRNTKIPCAATYISTGTDIDFGKLSQSIFQHATQKWNVHLFLHNQVTTIKRIDNNRQEISVVDIKSWRKKKINTSFVFIGAGWAALPLLQKSWVPQAKWFGGFPVSGQRLVCDNKDIIQDHHAKVYGLTEVWSPPMSVPHLDTRIIAGKKQLLFGPYAWFTTKFLKQWSLWDLFLSIRPNNIIPMLQAWRRNIWLTKYLIKQALQSQSDRMKALRVYFPNAKEQDRRLVEAGNRVQIIKKSKEWWILQFWTELVVSDDGSVAALLWASPWASTAVSIMIELLEKCFSQQMQAWWKEKISNMIPSYNTSNNTIGHEKIQQEVDSILWLID